MQGKHQTGQTDWSGHSLTPNIPPNSKCHSQIKSN
jgi:hypothetical protein